MKCLAIADLFIDKVMMEEGLNSLKEQNIELTVRTWEHSNLEALQEDNIKLEKNGSEAVSLPEELLVDVDDFDIVITQFAPLSTYTIDKLKNVKVIGVLRAGTENVNVSYAEDKGITVLNTPGRSITSVSEFAVGMILAEIRNIARSHQYLKEGKWEKNFPNGVLAPELRNSKIGLIGYGDIGSRVAELIRPFGAEILFYDAYFAGDTINQQVDSLEELVQTVDVISMHYRLTTETKGMLNRKHFELMKKSAIVINTARSGLIDEQDLIQALQEKKISGAAIDVYDDEPLSATHPYNTLDNVTITPHIAGSTIGNFANSPVILSEIIIKTLNENK
ncbi:MULTISPECIES: 2-hydroxyacid dehydrogenase [unclassified Staphylococcus]|uniref:2-hydroxyacid dehydrogenase n=1 Tax=unclassified Staphylococcus TaxID=91994 RepID=UPI001AEC7248|nr:MULTISPECIES: 2-hydroxyacid dehydrogenase [unclassified Staphylococcus]